MSFQKTFNDVKNTDKYSLDAHISHVIGIRENWLYYGRLYGFKTNEIQKLLKTISDECKNELIVHASEYINKEEIVDSIKLTDTVKDQQLKLNNQNLTHDEENNGVSIETHKDLDAHTLSNDKYATNEVKKCNFNGDNDKVDDNDNDDNDDVHIDDNDNEINDEIGYEESIDINHARNDKTNDKGDDDEDNVVDNENDDDDNDDIDDNSNETNDEEDNGDNQEINEHTHINENKATNEETYGKGDVDEHNDDDNDRDDNDNDEK